ncbi:MULTISPECIES: hypothetical protein [Pseudonocardia]|uniref:Uncharacterized protein n=2 Tax=Pseudonocardia TaxID=1847 RepID=A0A1Y2N685_PSEAH|nr:MULTISPECIES: hypothetical protein [Pseudonocardia]OSY42976.1 hypothetical protein BG845_01218 [Pseudonocardia autotrophica]TDN77552.1 hypothetical protein C8E95_6800 [Pseudonocardia autotrophica]BBG01582.1 hypothetical protein Pdca_27910 [Pseudonocardia autotrophica]GEC29072.1 hypothetical protein PSA01_61010 [Pseudonocardia saturnea]
MRRPSISGAAAALRTTDTRWSWIEPTSEEDDTAAVIEFIDATHYGTSDTPDRAGKWGGCGGCDDVWPCPTWLDTQNLAIQFLGRAADRYLARIREAK